MDNHEYMVTMPKYMDNIYIYICIYYTYKYNEIYG